MNTNPPALQHQSAARFPAPGLLAQARLGCGRLRRPPRASPRPAVVGPHPSRVSLRIGFRRAAFGPSVSFDQAFASRPPCHMPPLYDDNVGDDSGELGPIDPLFRCTRREHLSAFKGTGERQRNTGYPTEPPGSLAGMPCATLAARVRHRSCQVPGTPGLGTSCARSELASMLAALTLRVRLEDRRPRQRTISYTSSSGPSAAQGHPNGQPAADRPTTGLLDPPALLQIDPVVYFRR